VIFSVPEEERVRESNAGRSEDENTYGGVPLLAENTTTTICTPPWVTLNVVPLGGEIDRT
jgi:hypothetical protein